MVCRIGGAKSKETRYSMLKGRFGRILQLTVLNLQMKKPICKYSCRILPNLTFNILYLVSLLFAPPILHTTNHFLDTEVFDLLVPIIFLSLPWLSVFVAMYRTLRFLLCVYLFP